MPSSVRLALTQSWILFGAVLMFLCYFYHKYLKKHIHIHIAKTLEIRKCFIWKKMRILYLAR